MTLDGIVPDCRFNATEETAEPKDNMNKEQQKQAARFEREFRRLLISLKPDIADDYRATDDPDDDQPGMCVTFATTDFSSWSYQTGDNSFSGGCYGHPHWAVVYLNRRSNSRDLAHDAVEQLAESFECANT